MNKKVIIRRFLLLTILSVLAVSSSIEGSELKIPSLKGLPVVDKQILPNGITVLSVKDDLPRTEIYCTIGFGKMHENKDIAGISEILAKKISISGSGGYPSNELQSKLEAVGGEISISADWENIVIIIKVLSKHSELAFSILGDILRNPLLDDTDLSYTKKLVYDKFLREMDDPANAGFYKLREVIFDGKNYGTVISEKSINSITSGSLKNIWSRFACGGNINVAVSSSIDKSELSLLYKNYLKSINSGVKELYNIDNTSLISNLPEKSKNIYLVPKELEQATILIGTVAPDIKYHGNYSLFLMNYILGGGSFNSRLMNEIRVKRGLAYSVFSIVRNRNKTGVFMSFVQTRNEEVGKVLSLMKDNINGMSSNSVTQDELNWAKESVINSYIFNFAKTTDILANYLQIEFNDLDLNYYKDYPLKISKVKSEDIKIESEKLFNRGLVIVVVGKKELAETLKDFGKIIILE